MKLSFCARGDAAVIVPGVPRVAGMPVRRVGRAVAVDKEGVSFPASGTPFTCDSESDTGRRLMKMARQDALWAADKETAAACGVAFVDIEFSGGEWLPKKTSSAGRSQRSASTSTES